MTGRQRLEEILGHSALEWTAPHDLERNDREVRDCLARGLVRGLEVDYVAPDGRLIPIEVNATVLRTADRVQILTLCRDITDRKQVEKALQKSHHELEQRVTERTAELSKSRERLSTLFRQAPPASFSRSEDGSASGSERCLPAHSGILARGDDRQNHPRTGHIRKSRRPKADRSRF